MRRVDGGCCFTVGQRWFGFAGGAGDNCGAAAMLEHGLETVGHDTLTCSDWRPKREERFATDDNDKDTPCLVCLNVLCTLSKRLLLPESRKST